MATKQTRPTAGRKTPVAHQIRYAVVGLGYIAQVAVLPAFAHAKHGRLAALVSDDELKLKKLGAKYRVPLRYGYTQYDELLHSGEIDAVYIALPNSMHAEYANRAAAAGIHVLCEKPMAVTSAECASMIETARQHDVRLMIAYRLHFEAGNLAAIDLVQSGQLGEPRIFSADFTMQVRDEKNIRLSAPLGGGTLYDIGIYCINAARYLFRSEPNEVWAWASRKNEERFSEVEEMVSAILRFPENRVATFTCSFGAADVSSYRVIGTNGDLRVEPAFDYADEIVHHVKIGKRSRVKRFAKRDQFAAELDHFALCIRDGTEPATGGIEGLNDVRIIEMLYESAHKGVPIALTLPEPEVRPGPSSNIQRPPVKKPELVRANGPSGGNE